MKVVLREKTLKDKFSLYLDIYADGKRTYKFLKLYPILKPKNAEERTYNATIRRKAEIIRAKSEMELIDNNYKLKPKGSNMLFVDYFKELTLQRKKSPGNYGNWDSTLKILQKYLNGDEKKISEVTDDDLLKIKNFIQDEYTTKSNEKLSQNAASSYFNKIKACLNQAFDEKIIENKVGIRVKSIKAEETRREYLTIDEVNKIVDYDCDFLVLKNAFLFSAFTGLRWSDINKLIWKNLKHSKESGYWLEYKMQKTGAVETLNIPQRAVSYIGERQGEDERIFKGLKYSAWHNLKLAQWMAKAGIHRHITFHSARHTFCTMLISKNVDIYTVSKLVGHKNITTTQIYSKVIDQKKIEAINVLDNLI
jgi:integrase